jgi:hypothetical protein
VIGVVIYVIVAHPRGLAAALPAAGIPLAVALHQAYGADLLAQSNYAGADARAQGRSLLLVVIACVVAAGVLRWLALAIDRRLVRRRIGTRTRTIVFGGAAIAALLALAVGLAAFDLDHKVSDEWHAFEEGNRPPGGVDLRTRLTKVGNNGRLDIWHVALREAAQHPWHGSGAGTFQLAWDRDRPAPPLHIVDGHSLFYETRAELGWVGVVLLLVTLAVPLGVAISRLWGPGRHAHAAFLAAAAALLLHAMVDWDWEMPAVFLWFFGAAGAVIAAPASALERARAPRRLTRVAAGLAFLVLAVTPLTVSVSGSRLNAAQAAFRTGDCVKATSSALGSLDALASQAAAFEILGWCDLRSGRRRLALAAMRNAQRRDPGNWQYAYGVAVTQALAGQDPRAAAARARRLNPLDPQTAALVKAVRPAGAARRRANVAKLSVPTG